MRRLALGIAALSLGLACAGPSLRYALATPARPPAGLAERHPDYVAVLGDPARTDVPNLLGLRDDLERAPVDARNYDALNAVAWGYFETLRRQEEARADEGSGMAFLELGFRSARLVAVPWRAYGEIDDPALRDAIVAFFEDAGSGRRPGTRPSLGRLPRIVDSLAAKEPDPARRARIEALRDAIVATVEAESVVPGESAVSETSGTSERSAE